MQNFHLELEFLPEFLAGSRTTDIILWFVLVSISCFHRTVFVQTKIAPSAPAPSYLNDCFQRWRVDLNFWTWTFKKSIHDYKQDSWFEMWRPIFWPFFLIWYKIRISVRFSYPLRINNFCKGPQNTRKCPQTWQKIVRCLGFHVRWLHSCPDLGK